MTNLQSAFRRLPAAVAVLALCTLAPPRAAGELPPYVYKERQDAAPEALEIKVRSVKTKQEARGNYTLFAHTVEAVVEKVERTATDLKPGAVIQIFYTQRRTKTPEPGPSEVPTLKEGQVCPAYLSWTKEAEVYSPAAGGYSFDKVGN